MGWGGEVGVACLPGLQCHCKPRDSTRFILVSMDGASCQRASSWQHVSSSQGTKLSVCLDAHRQLLQPSGILHGRTAHVGAQPAHYVVDNVVALGRTSNHHPDCGCWQSRWRMLVAHQQWPVRYVVSYQVSVPCMSAVASALAGVAALAAVY